MKRIACLLTALILLGMITENQAQSTKLKMKTSFGDITIMLYDDTPSHRDSIIKLVNQKFYDGQLFHRVIPKFMIQTGDPFSKNAQPGQMLGGDVPGYALPKIPAEIKPNHYHKYGALAAARQGDDFNPKFKSSGSQFYIVVGEVLTAKDLETMEITGRHPKFTAEQKKIYTTIGGFPDLDMKYTVYGEVTSGMDVVEKISKVPCGRANRPTQDVKIISIEVQK